MAFGKVYGYTENPRTRAVLVTAEYEGVDVELVETNPHGPSGLSADYTKKFPLAKIPAFESSKVTLTQCVVIANYIASQSNKANLLGSNKEDAALIQMWVEFANMELQMGLGAWFAPLLGRIPYNKAAVEQAKTNVNKSLDYLEKTLQDRTFLVGERVTLADIFVGSVLGRGFQYVLDAEWRKSHVNTVRYFHTVARQPAFFKVNGEPTLTEKAIVYTPPKKEAAAPAAKKEAAKPAAAAAKKPAAAEEDDEPAAAPKPKHPCEALGPAKSFPLDEFKRQYSNSDTPVAFKWFEEHYDPQEYSIWQAKYKYNDELGQPYQSNNLITGFHTRLEASRKYLFGNGGVYGTQGNSAIMGVYVLRGSNHEDVFGVAPDWESYDFVQLDLAKDRQTILDSWSWEGSYNGLEHSGQAKTFK